MTKVTEDWQSAGAAAAKNQVALDKVLASLKQPDGSALQCTWHSVSGPGTAYDECDAPHHVCRVWLV